MRFSPFILVCALLTGCVHYEPRPLDVPRNTEQLLTRSLESPELKAFLEKTGGSTVKQWPMHSWNFNSLVLAAYFYHPSLSVARAQWRTAEAAVLTAGGRSNPTVTVSPGFNSDSASGVTPWMPAMSFDIPIETAHKRDFRLAVARHLSESAKFNISITAWQLRSNVRNALMNYVAAEGRAKLMEESRRSFEHLLKSAKQSAAAGAIGENEVRPAIIAVNKARLDAIDSERQVKEARVRIAEAVGVSGRAMEDVEFAFEFTTRRITAKSLAEARQLALQNRPDILAALAEYAAAESTLQSEIAKQYPDVHISPSYQWDQGESKWALGVTVELPVLNRNQGPIAEAKARREESAARFLALQAKALSEIDSAMTGYRATIEQLELVDRLLMSQREQLKSIEAQEKAGVATQGERLAAQIEVNTVELNRFDTKIKLQQAIGAIEDALQTPLFGEVTWVAGITTSTIRTPNE